MVLKGLGLKQFFLHKVSFLEKNPILVFGFPKTGTSAITGLLAARANLSVTIDTKYLWEPYISRIISGDLPLDKHLNKYSYPFSKKIIKEPNFVFIVDQLLDFYDNPKVIRIYRDKKDTIKSILVRLELPGNLPNNPNPAEVSKNWHNLIFEKEKHYIDVLSYKYELAYDNLQKLEKLNPIDVEYDEFKRAKSEMIDFIAKSLDLPFKKDITKLLNKQFQPKGVNDQSHEEFFGKNYTKLN